MNTTITADEIYNRIWAHTTAAMATHLLPLGIDNNIEVSNNLSEQTKQALTEAYHYGRGLTAGEAGDPTARYWKGAGSNIAYELRSEYLVDGTVDRDALAQDIEEGELLKRAQTMAARQAKDIFRDLQNMNA